MKTKHGQALTKLIRAGVAIGAPLAFLRGKQLKGNSWIYSYMSVRTNGKSTEPYCALDGFEVDPFTVTAWTGKYDKNMTAIFGGDILRYSFEDEDGKECEELYFVHWSREQAAYAIGWLKNPEEDGLAGSDLLEVIGNVFDNPELAAPFLKSGEKLRGENV